MFPFTFSFGFFQIGVYGMMMIMAILWGVVGLWRSFRLVHVPKMKAFLFSTLILISSLLTARCVGWYSEGESWEMLFDFSFHHFSLPGAVLGGGGILIFVLYFLRIPPWKFLDTLVLPFAGGVLLARVGCFLHGCCFGHESSLPWALKFPLMSPPHLHQLSEGKALFEVLSVHPTQLYEIIGVAGILIILSLRRRMLLEGENFLFFVFLFSLLRLINDFFRVYTEEAFLMLPYYTFGYVLCSMLAIFFLVYGGLVQKSKYFPM